MSVKSVASNLVVGYFFSRLFSTKKRAIVFICVLFWFTHVLHSSVPENGYLFSFCFALFLMALPFALIAMALRKAL